jgi:molybdopterin converting factor small subunit
MKIYLEWIGLLHIQGTKNHSFVKLKNNATISSLYDQIKIKKEHQKFISCFVNGTEMKMFSNLKDGDKVRLFLPTGGG